MNVGEKIGDFVLAEISHTKNRRGLPVYTFTHSSTGLQYEFHGRIPDEEELIEAHREWAPNHSLRRRLAEYAELERMFLLVDPRSESVH